MDRWPVPSPQSAVAAVFRTALVVALVVPMDRGTMVKRLAAIAALALLALPFHAAATSTVTVTNGWGWVRPPMVEVGVVGDSLVYQAEHGTVTSDPYYRWHYLTDEFLAQGWASRIAARSGADTRSLRMWGGWESAPDVVVMALGTNDRRWEPPTFPLSLGTSQWNVVNYLNRWPRACPVLVGIVEFPNRWRHDVYGPAWNNWLRYLAGLRGGVYVDWAGYSAGHADWFTPDLLHMTVAGQAGYRTAITEGVQRCP